jgi:hypothetical protein
MGRSEYNNGLGLLKSLRSPSMYPCSSCDPCESRYEIPEQGKISMRREPCVTAQCVMITNKQLGWSLDSIAEDVPCPRSAVREYQALLVLPLQEKAVEPDRLILYSEPSDPSCEQDPRACSIPAGLSMAQCALIISAKQMRTHDTGNREALAIGSRGIGGGSAPTCAKQENAANCCVDQNPEPNSAFGWRRAFLPQTDCWRGWLLKRSRATIPSWQRRWFELRRQPPPAVVMAGGGSRGVAVLHYRRHHSEDRNPRLGQGADQRWKRMEVAAARREPALDGPAGAVLSVDVPGRRGRTLLAAATAADAEEMARALARRLRAAAATPPPPPPPPPRGIRGR